MNDQTFRALADLVEGGLSPSRAAKSLRLNPSTIGAWRKQFPEFDEMIAAAESRFIAKMTSLVATAAVKDWRAAVELLTRRFPSEFGANAAAGSREEVAPQRDREAELIEVARTPSGRSMLLTLRIITPAWIAERFPNDAPRLLPGPAADPEKSNDPDGPHAREGNP